MTQMGLDFSGVVLRDSGMDAAVKHADLVNDNWSEQAFSFMVAYCRKVERFLVEDVRTFAAAHGLPDPPSARAWGAVVVRAARLGLIFRAGYQSVKNPKAHCTPASVWQVAS